MQVAQCLHETLQYRVIVFVVGPGWWFEGGYYQIPRARTQPAKEAKEAFRANKPGNSCCCTGLTSFWVKLTAIILLRLNWQWAEVILVPHNTSTKSWKEGGGAEPLSQSEAEHPVWKHHHQPPPTTHPPANCSALEYFPPQELCWPCNCSPTPWIIPLSLTAIRFIAFSSRTSCSQIVAWGSYQRILSITNWGFEIFRYFLFSNVVYICLITFMDSPSLIVQLS